MKKIISLGIACMSLLVVTPALAANQGTVGATSQGSAVVNLSIADLIRISDMNDFALGSYSGTGDLDANDNVCVWRNKTGGSYKVTATATEGAFKIKAGAEELAYSVFFNDQTGTSGEIAVAYNTVTATQTGANTQSASCATGGLSSNIHIRILESALQAAQPGAYTGTLIVTVEPV